MRFGLPNPAIGALARLLVAAALVAVVAVGAPLHSHDIAAFGSDPAPLQKAPCAACVTNASPGLLLAVADFTPRLEAVDVVSVDARAVVSLPVPARPGRAPPTV